MNRRKFIKHTSITTAAIVLGSANSFAETKPKINYQSGKDLILLILIRQIPHSIEELQPKII
jgi:hypothetical protein